MTIIITGGHPTPAFAFVEYLNTFHSDVKVVFVGRVTTRRSDRQPSPEQMMAKRYQTEFVALDAPKFAFGLSLHNLWRFIALIVSTIRAWLIVHKIKPDVIVCFGSYLAVPIAIAGYISGISLITHEQTRGLGRANQFIAHFARYLALSHPLTQNRVTQKIQVIGNLLRPSLFTHDLPMPNWLPKPTGQLPYLYITGGEQGSEIINATIGQILPQLVKNFTIIHQCGPASQKRNYYQELTALGDNLSPNLRQRYVVKEWLTDQELGYLYQHQTLVLARSGANTIDEITAFQLPSLLIPLPFSQGQEQLQNAMSLVHSQAAILLEQKDLNAAQLLNQLSVLKQNANQMRQAFPQDIDYSLASVKLWRLVESSLNT